jgi:hypothetical protein
MKEVTLPHHLQILKENQKDYEELYTNDFDNSDEMSNFLKDTNY